MVAFRVAGPQAGSSGGIRLFKTKTQLNDVCASPHLVALRVGCCCILITILLQLPDTVITKTAENPRHPTAAATEPPEPQLRQQ